MDQRAQARTSGEVSERDQYRKLADEKADQMVDNRERGIIEAREKREGEIMVRKWGWVRGWSK